MPRNKKDVEKALQGKGFIQTDNDHHFFVYVPKEGQKTRARTKTSHGSKMKDIPDKLLSQMAKQCKITNSEFLNLIDCPLDRDGYEELLSQKGEL